MQPAGATVKIAKTLWISILFQLNATTIWADFWIVYHVPGTVIRAYIYKEKAGHTDIEINEEGEPEKVGTLDGYIKDMDGDGIGGAYIKIEGLDPETADVTNEDYSLNNGFYDFLGSAFPYGNWMVTVNKEGYDTKEETITIDEEHEHIDFVLTGEGAPEYELEVTALVNYEGTEHIVENANITVAGETRITNENGVVTFTYFHTIQFCLNMRT